MKLSVQIASVPDREGVVAEIWMGDEMIGEVQGSDEGEFVLEIYARADGCPWRLSLDDWLDALAEAREQLD